MVIELKRMAHIHVEYQRLAWWFPIWVLVREKIIIIIFRKIHKMLHVFNGVKCNVRMNINVGKADCSDSLGSSCTKWKVARYPEIFTRHICSLDTTQYFENWGACQVPLERQKCLILLLSNSSTISFFYRYPILKKFIRTKLYIKMVSFNFLVYVSEIPKTGE